LKALVTDPHPQIDLYVNDSDLTFLKIILEVGVVVSGVNMTQAIRFQGTERRNQVSISQWDIPSHL